MKHARARWFALSCAVSALSSGCGDNLLPCKDGTIFLALELDTVSSGADDNDLTITVGTVTQSLHEAHGAGTVEDTYEIDFPAAYPSNESFSISVVARSKGAALGAGTTRGTLSGTCDKVTVKIAASNLTADSGVTDGAPLFDLRPSDLPDQAIADQSRPVDQSTPPSNLDSTTDAPPMPDLPDLPDLISPTDSPIPPTDSSLNESPDLGASPDLFGLVLDLSISGNQPVDQSVAPALDLTIPTTAPDLAQPMDLLSPPIVDLASAPVDLTMLAVADLAQPVDLLSGCLVSGCAGNGVCDVSSGLCVACLADGDCPAGALCAQQQCVAGCNGAHGCAGALACCGGACTDVSGDVNHCGTCDTVCAGGASQCQSGVGCNNGSCQPLFLSSTPCDDGNPCTMNDTCDGGGGCSGTAYSCSPSQCESASSCDGQGGCNVTYQDSSISCDDGNICTNGDVCNGAGGCAGTPLVCDSPPECYTSGDCNPADGTCRYAPSPIETPCSDDGNECTSDWCFAGTCGHYAADGASCSIGTCCGSNCTNLYNDPNNCGGCGIVCDFSHSYCSPECGGTCQMDPFDDCQ